MQRNIFKFSMKSGCNFSEGKRGAVVCVPKGKTRITLCIDDNVLDWFRSQVEESDVDQ